MPGSGTRTFVGPDQYEAGLRPVQVELVVTSPGEFKARLTWAELHRLQLFRVEEELPRIAFLSLPPRLLFVAFPIGPGPLPVWRGAIMQASDILLHKVGERLHQVTTGPSTWSVIALEPALLEEYGQVLLGRRLPRAQQGQVLRPVARDAARLQRLHAQACRLAETKPKILTHSEVARAIEQDVIHALVTCLATAKIRTDGTAKCRHALTMVRFEEVLAERPGQPPRLRELCAQIGVTGRTLRSCCAEFLGISPTRYVLLRRLKQVHAALRDADPATANIAELARGFGFTQPGRFAGIYRAAFGETPSATLRRVDGMRFISPANFVKSA